MGITAEQESRRCHRCGEPLAGAELSGNCPRCLATLLLSPESADAVESSPIPILRRLGDYELLEEVARGGMGVVFRARQVSLDRIVAVKVLRDAWLATPVQVKRFQAEAANAAKLKHPNIVAVHEVGEEAGQHYFAMDLIKGSNLAETTREGPLPPHRAAELVRKVAEAVQHAHQEGVLHRDVKPSNVLLDAQGVPHVTDFGLARPMDEESSLTLTGQVLGTPGYMAPEQAKGGATAGPAADVYGLGALLFHLLTGRAPFVGASAAETLTQVLQQEPLSPRLLNPTVPVDVAAVCLKCLRKTPRERYDSAGELAADLGRFLGNETTHARPEGPVERSVRWCRRKPVVAGLTLGLLSVTVLGIAGIVWQWQEARREAAQARLNAYRADMNLAARAVEENNIEYVVESLDRYRPEKQARDIRGWEWRYLWHQCQSDSLQTIGTHSNEVRALAFTPDNQVLISGGRDATLKFWEAGTWRLRQTFPLPAGVRSMALSTDGHKLVVGMENGKVALWALPGMEQLFPKESSAWNAANCLAFQPDGKAFAIGGRRGQVQIVETSSGLVTRTLRVHQDMIRALAFSPDGAFLASGSQDYPGVSTNMLVLWDARKWIPLAKFNPHPWVVLALRFSPDSSLLASGGWEDAVRLWSTHTFQPAGSLNGHTLPCRALSFSADGSLLASGGIDQTIILWDLVKREAVARYHGHLGEVWALEYSSDAETLVSGGKDGTIRHWKGKPSPKQRAFHPLPPGVARGFASRNAGIGAATTSRGTIEVWDMPAARNIGSVAGQVAALTADGQWLASGTTGGVVTVFAISNLQAVAHLSTKRPVDVMEFDNAGAKLATLDHDSRAMVWKWRKQERSGSWTISAACRSLAFSPDGQILALGLASGAIEFRNPNDAEGKLDRTLTGHNSEVLSVQFSPDGQWFLSGGADFTARIWDVRSGRQMAVLKADRIGVFAVDFSPDGSRVITGAMDGTIRFWNFAARHQVLTLKGHRMQPALAFADGDRQLISISADGIRYWRAPSWEEIAAAEPEVKRREAR